jgi:predicted lysophospholipase L1 biosynthesis ABC-type transport system permease subunit
VVAGVKHFTLEEEPTGAAYAPLAQVPPGTVSFLANNLNLVVRAAGDPEAGGGAAADSASLIGAVRRLVGLADPNVATSSLRTMEQVLESSVAARRFNMRLLLIFASLSIVLAACGLHALMACSVVQRTREIAIRMALGARPAGVLQSFVGRGLRLAIAGIGLGLAGALLLTRSVAGLLYGVAPTDASTFLLAPLVLAVVAVLASYIPARRIMRMKPMAALRCD